MTVDEFQKKYHDYSTEDEMEAISDALKVNAVLEEGQVRPVKIGNLYCIMLNDAANLMEEIGVL